MAEFSLSSNHSQLSAKIVYSYTQSVSGNYSDVSATLYIKKNQSIATSGTWSGDINVGGSGNSGSQYYKLVDSWQSLCDVSKRVYHNADGTGSVTISGSARGPKGTSMSSASASGSKTISLPRIARTSSVSATSAKIGATSTITISRQSSSFTHTLTYSFKGETTTALTGTIVSKTSDTSVSWTIPKDFYNKIPNSTSGTVTITCTTYSGSTSVGSSTCTLTASANSADVKVSFNPTYKDTNSTTAALTGDSSKLVKYYSTAKITSNATGAYGATIKSQSIKCGSKTVSSSPASFPNVEIFTFTFSATDSRGYKTTKNLATTNVVDYCKLTAYIGNETPAADGTYTFKVKGNYFNGSFGAVNNTLTVNYRWKVSGGTFSNWQNMTLSISGNTYVASASLSGLDYQTTYIFQAQATDKLMVVDTGEKTIKSKPTFDWSGEDFAFNVPVSIEGYPLADFVIEDNYNGNWHYRKWYSGRLEAWNNLSQSDDEITYQAHSNSNGIYRWIGRVPLPSGLFSSVEYSVVNGTFTIGWWSGSQSNVSLTTESIEIVFFTVDKSYSDTKFPGDLPLVFIVGRWKE